MNNLIALRKARLDAAAQSKYSHEHVRALADAAAQRGVRHQRRGLAVGASAVSALALSVAVHRWESEPVEPPPTIQVVQGTPPKVVEPTVPYKIEQIGSTDASWTHTETTTDPSPHVRLETGDVRVATMEPLRVDVAPQPGVDFEQATVESKDAVFVIVRQQAAVLVASEHGSLKIHVDGKVHYLDSGERLVLGSSKRAAPRTDDTRSKGMVSRQDWKSLATSGEMEAARAALRGVRLRRPEDLMLAADVLRRTGHPAQAESYLRRIVDEYPRNATAPVAAFTLGKLYLGSLNRPTEAARMFARVRKRSAKGALAEDALAREVESWAKAGERDKARSLALTYLDRHAQGRYAAVMRGYID